MKYKALETFSGALSAVKGQLVEIHDEFVATDLLNAGYIKKHTERKAVKNDDKGTGRRRSKNMAKN